MFTILLKTKRRVNHSETKMVHLIQISLPQWQCSALAKTANKSQLLHVRSQFPLISSSPRTASLASGSTTKCRHFETGTATHTKPANTNTRFYTNPWTPWPGPSRPLRVCKCSGCGRAGLIMTLVDWPGQAVGPPPDSVQWSNVNGRLGGGTRIGPGCTRM